MKQFFIIIWFISLIPISNKCFAAGDGPDSLCDYSYVDSLLGVGSTLSRPSGLNDSISTSHFWIHFTPTGPDSFPRTDAQLIGVFAESSWTIEGTNLGWQLPPSDNGSTSDNDGRYDIYIHKLNSKGWGGLTWPEENSSWIEINNTIRPPSYPINEMRLVVAHEFNHACQYTYDVNARVSTGSWFLENTATWISQYVFPYAMDRILFRINALDGPLQSAEKKITTSDGTYEYGGALWCNFLAEWRNDSTIIRKIFERMGTTKTRYPLSAINYVLSFTYSSSLTEALRQYAIWRNFTWTRSDSYHFRNATLYAPSSPYSYTSSGYPITLDTSRRKPSGPGGCRIWDFLPNGSSLTVTFDGQNHHQWAAFLIGMKMPQPSTITEILLDTNALGSTTVQWSSADSFALVPVVLDTSMADTLSFSMSATIDPRLSVTFSNKIHDLDAGGQLLLDNIDTLTSGQSRLLYPDTTHTVKTLNERFVVDSTYKQHDWNYYSTESRLSHSFIVQPNQREQDANFLPLNPATVCNELIDAPQLNAGTIWFHDPWYVDSTGHQPDSLIQSTSPFHPVGAYNQSSGGVFLNQGDILHLQPPYYSVKSGQTQTFSTYINCPFIGWAATKNSEIINSDSLQSPVIFHPANDTIIARYKGYMITSDSIATKGSGERKVITYVGTSYMVYESGGSIFYTKNSGSGWSPEFPITISRTAKNPSIALTVSYSPPHTYIHIVWEDTANLPSVGNRQIVIYRRSTDGNWESPFALMANYQDWTAKGVDATPTVTAYGNMCVVAWRFLTDFSGGIVIWPEPALNSAPKVYGVRNSDTTSRLPALNGDPGPLAVCYGHGNGIIRYQGFSVNPDYTVSFDTSMTDLSSQYTYMTNSTNPTVAGAYPSVYVAWEADNGSSHYIYFRERNSG